MTEFWIQENDKYMLNDLSDYSPGQARGGSDDNTASKLACIRCARRTRTQWHSINIRTPQGLWDEALCQSIFTLRPDSPEGRPYYRTLFILFPAWGWHSQSHLLFMLCSFKFNSTVHYYNLIVYYILF